MELYCLGCNAMSPFSKFEDPEEFRCVVQGGHECYYLRWSAESGYILVGIRCDTPVTSFATFCNEELVCSSCENTYCENDAYFASVKAGLFAAMKLQFAGDSFNPIVWENTFPISMWEMCEERKKAILQNMTELELFPSVIDNIVASYT